MDADRENKVAYIKDQIEQGSYRVDPKAVADAIVRRLRQLVAAGAEPQLKTSAHSRPARR